MDAPFADARLSLVDDILITAGWIEHAGGWLPPEKYRRAIEVGHGRGHWDRAYAIAFMVQADQHAVAISSDHTTKPGG